MEDVGLKGGVTGLRESWRPGRALLAVPVALIVVIATVDILLPNDIYLGPLLVIAPAITSSFEGPVLTGVVGLLTVGAQAFIALHSGVLTSRNALVQIAALAILSALTVFFCLIRERHIRQLARVRSVAETTQKVLLRPLPDRIGPLRIASLYLAAEDEAQIGGDLYAATRVEGGTRMMIGDVRGKGLAAIEEAALLLGAFREAAHQYTGLPALAAALDRSVTRYHADFEPEDGDDTGERFVTALLLEIPEDGPVSRMTSCGHPAPLLLSPGHAESVPSRHPAPPLGIGDMGPAGYTVDMFDFEAETPSSFSPTASSKRATDAATSTRSRNAPPSGRRARRRHSCTSCDATSSPMSADVWATTPPSSRSTAAPSPIRNTAPRISFPDGFS